MNEAGSSLSQAHRPFAEGVYHSAIAVLARGDAEVKAMLPRGLSLARQRLTPENTHPVVLMFGRHTDVRPRFLPIRGGRYSEFILAIPYLNHETTGTYRGPFVFMKRLYLDSWLAVVAGWFYAFAKRRARVHATEETYSIRSLLAGAPIASAEFEPHGDSGPTSKFPHFRALSPIFEQPFIGRLPLGLFECSWMQFELMKATLRAVTLTAELDALPGLPQESVKLRGLDRDPLGAFTIRVPWTLSLPFSCARVRKKATAIEGIAGAALVEDGR